MSYQSLNSIRQDQLCEEIYRLNKHVDPWRSSGIYETSVLYKCCADRGIPTAYYRAWYLTQISGMGDRWKERATACIIL